MNMVRLRRTKLIFGLIMVCVIFWCVLYWNFTSLYAEHKRHKLLLRHAAQDSLPNEIKSKRVNADVEVYSEIILERLAKVETAEEQRKFDEGYHNHAFNQLLSDKLSYTRPIPDIRSDRCKDKDYSADLPHTSIVICFYNEAMSVLLRTVHTVLARSPEHLIHEIILVDDFSTYDYLKGDLEYYVRQNLPNVKVFHTIERMGLIRARIFGAKQATGQVLLFLDSHCEVNIGWLEPLLDMIHSDRKTVAVPIMDIINADTFFYEVSGLVRGGFNWGMHYQWDPLPSSVAKKVNEHAVPYESPTMAGGLFAMDRLYFHELGEYDSGMDIWGAENLELSFRIWQCGGRLVIVPCSRVGHIFRKRRPYGSPVHDSFTKNTLRMVHVWLDQYKAYYFHINPRAEDMEYGDIKNRIKLRRDLKCESFSWYLKHVYPQQLDKLPDLSQPLNLQNAQKDSAKLPPKVAIRARGQLKHLGSGLCVQSEKEIHDKRAMLQLAVCQPGNSDQIWYETEQKDLRLANLLCMDVNENEGPFARLMKCKGSMGQQWIWYKEESGHRLMNYGTAQCLTATEVDPGALLKTMTCSDSAFMRFDLASNN